MERDCGRSTNTAWFRYRTGGIAVKDGRALFVRSSIGGYLYIIGGGVQLGETSLACAEREFLEETGASAKALRLSVICENFFRGKGGTIDGLDCHTIEFYYIMDIADSEMPKLRGRTDSGEELIWVPLDRVREFRVKPDFMGERLTEVIGSGAPLHIIEERDR